MSETPTLEGWSGTDVTVSEVERELAKLRSQGAARDGRPDLRTSVLTHLAWIPPEWEQAALDTLAGLGERHPSRSILLLPQFDAEEDGIDAEISLRRFEFSGLENHVCSEVVILRLRGRRALVPASVVQPLLIFDLPVFLRWRGLPPFGREPFVQMVELVDRLIVDSTEWPGLPAPYAQLSQIFDRTAVSDIAWARTSRWRRQLASLWPEIANVRRIRVTGTASQAQLLVGWLRSRLQRPEIEVEHVPADRLVGVDVDGQPAPFPPGEAPPSSDLLSDELERFGRDPVYEDAVRGAAAAAG